MSLTTKPAVGTWRQVHPRPRGHHARRVEFRFFPKYVYSLWRGPTGEARHPSVRAPGGLFKPEILLLDDVVLLPNDSMFVRAWLIPSSKPDHYSMRVEMFAPLTVPRNVHVRLWWNATEYEAIHRAGNYFFEDITPPDYSRHKNNMPTHDLSLAFEFEKHSPRDTNDNPKTNATNGKPSRNDLNEKR